MTADAAVLRRDLVQRLDDPKLRPDLRQLGEEDVALIDVMAIDRSTHGVRR